MPKPPVVCYGLVDRHSPTRRPFVCFVRDRKLAQECAAELNLSIEKIRYTGTWEQFCRRDWLAEHKRTFGPAGCNDKPHTQKHLDL